MLNQHYNEQVYLKKERSFSAAPSEFEPQLLISLEEPLNCICTQVTHFL